MADGEPSEGYVDVGGGRTLGGRSGRRPPRGGGVAAQPVAEPQVGSLMDPGHLAVDVGGAEPIAVLPPVLATLMQQMQVLEDGQQALAGRNDALDNKQGRQ